MVPDPYKALGLPHEASQDDIKKAYRKLALKLHPDRLARRNVSPEEINTATSKFSAVTSAYAILSDQRRKRDYDHIYKYGGYDDLPEAKPQRTESRQDSNTSFRQGPPQMGIGYSLADPITYILSHGKIRSVAVAGVNIPSRFHMATSPEGGFRLSFSSAHVKESSSGTVEFKSKTTQFSGGKKFSKVETTTIHNDGRKEVIIEGDDYVERRVSTAPRRTRSRRVAPEDDDLTHKGDERPWYMNAWNGLRDNIENCATNPCGAIAVQ